MSSEVNVNVTGYLGGDSEMRYLANGTAVLNFSVAGRSGYGDNEQAVWVSCSLFGQRAESLHEYLTKGTLVAVSGRVSSPINKENPYFNVTVNSLSLLGGGSRREEVVEEQQVTEEIPF